jgi:protein ImuB
MSASPQGELPFVGGVAEAAPVPEPVLVPGPVPALAIATSPRPRGVSPVVAAPSPDAAAVPASRELWLAVRVAQPERFTDVALGFTSRAVLDPPDLLLLELRGSLRLFGGFRALFRQLRGRLPDDAGFALAPVPLAAAAFARAGRRLRCTDLPRMREALRSLPLDTLPWPDDTLARLASMGLVTIGDVQRLPREGLARRFGPGSLALLDRLFGGRADARAAIVPSPRFSERVELPAETFDQQRLLQALGPALERLEGFLRSRQRGLLALRVDLQHRRALPTRCVLRLARPGLRAADFASLLTERLAREQLPEPVRGLRLLAGRLVEFPATSANLWRAGEQGGRLAGESFQLLERLRSRLGDTAVRGLRLVEEHRPERAGGLCPPDGAAAADGAPVRGRAPRISSPWPPRRRAGRCGCWASRGASRCAKPQGACSPASTTRR